MIKSNIPIIIILLLFVIVFLFTYEKKSLEGFDDNKIPKIIIQTWKDDDPPKKYYNEIASIRKYNPDYKYLFFTDKTIDEFIKDFYPEYYKVFKRLPVNIQKIDFFRYIAVYHYGGFYFDLDMLCLEPLDDLLQYDAVFPQDLTVYERKCLAKMPRYVNICKNKNIKFLVGQYAFGAKKNDPFIKALIDNIANNIDKIAKNKDDSLMFVYETTGPDYVTNVYLDWDDKQNVHILRYQQDQCFGKYAIHNHYGTWK